MCGRARRKRLDLSTSWVRNSPGHRVPAVAIKRYRGPVGPRGPARTSPALARGAPRAKASRTRLVGGVPGPVDGGLECRGPGGRRELELGNEVPTRLAESPGVVRGLPHLEDACARLDGADDPAEAAVRQGVVTSGALVHRLVSRQVEVVVPFQEGAERHDGLLVTWAPSPRTRRGRRLSTRG